MRSILILALALLALLGGLSFGQGRFASAEEEGDDARLRELEAEVAALKVKTRYLMMRETDMSVYVLRNQERGTALAVLADRMVELGFTNRAIPANSREAFIAGLRALAADLTEGLPVLTVDQRQLLEAAVRFDEAD